MHGSTMVVRFTCNEDVGSSSLLRGSKLFVSEVISKSKTPQYGMGLIKWWGKSP